MYAAVRAQGQSVDADGARSAHQLGPYELALAVQLRHPRVVVTDDLSERVSARTGIEVDGVADRTRRVDTSIRPHCDVGTAAPSAHEPLDPNQPSVRIQLHHENVFRARSVQQRDPGAKIEIHRAHEGTGHVQIAIVGQHQTVAVIVARTAEPAGPDQCSRRGILGEEAILGARRGQQVLARSRIEIQRALEIARDIDVPRGIGDHRRGVVDLVLAGAEREPETGRRPEHTRVPAIVVLACGKRQRSRPTRRIRVAVRRVVAARVLHREGMIGRQTELQRILASR